MRTGLIIIVLITLTLDGCNKRTPVIVIDSWWNVDFAKDTCRSASAFMKDNRDLIRQFGCDGVTACPEQNKVYLACVTDDTGGVSDFELALQTQLAERPECAGLSVVQYRGPSDRNTTWRPDNETDWSLTLNYSPGSQTQYWQMTNPSYSLFQGSGTPVEIAKSVCAIVARRGANVSN